MMKIGIFTETFLPQVNGVVTSICNMNRILLRYGHRVSVFTVGKGPERVDGYDVYRFKGMTFKPYPGYKFFLPTPRAWRFMKERGVDIAHVRSSVVMGVVARRLSKKLGVPIIGTFDTPLSEYIHYIPMLGSFAPTRYLLSRAANRYIVWCYNQCDLVTAPSHTAREYLIKSGCRKRIDVVSNGVDTEKYSPRNRDGRLKIKHYPDNEFLIIHVGRIAKEKNVSVLIEAGRLLCKRGFNFKLVIIGDGPARAELQSMVRKLGLQRHIEFAGHVPEEQLCKYYASADLFVTASTVETQGIVLLEAMASGCPVIGANAGAIPELVRDGDNGFLFEPGNAGMLANLIEGMLKDEDLKGMKRQCLRTIREHSIESVAKRFEGFYRELTGN